MVLVGLGWAVGMKRGGGVVVRIGGRLGECVVGMGLAMSQVRLAVGFGGYCYLCGFGGLRWGRWVGNWLRGYCGAEEACGGIMLFRANATGTSQTGALDLVSLRLSRVLTLFGEAA